MYSISRQETTGLWVVKDDSTGKNISRGDTPLIAINLAIEKGMPSENKEALLIEANYIIKQEEEANAAKSAAAPPVSAGEIVPPPAAPASTATARPRPPAMLMHLTRTKLPTLDSMPPREQ